ncbi:MAG: hypothetical protein HYS21_06840 [Deltaproteobacteria bacterium]|nr:hypothetical protein [Deltaproteobacteria bacterium]
MLSLYTVFHCNLAFSSIPREHFPDVVEKCYWPILELCEQGFPLAIEMPAWTLKEVEKIDPAFISKLSHLLKEGRCEFIGSGFSQAIFPLIPADVNKWNLEIGDKYYKELLGKRPAIALVNEQTYSRGIVDIYRDTGYEAIIMDWNNSFQYNRYPKEYLYSPQRAAGIKGDINVLWSHSIAFQKFQRCVHGELSIEEYMDWLFSNDNENEDRAFALYTNDAEVFDYRPGHEAVANGEYKRMGEILKKIAASGKADFLTPTGIINKFKKSRSAFNIIQLESAETPVVCKKQEKYNPLRWAVAGRDSVHINTECYKVYNNIKTLIGQGNIDERTLDDYRETLCDLWGSDFRTNTVDGKFQYFQNRLGWLKLETEKNIIKTPAAQPAMAGAAGLEHIAVPMINKSAKQKATITTTENTIKVLTESVEVEFLKGKGSAIKSLAFPAISKKPVIGTLSHGHFEDIRLGADFFSGHLIHTSKDGRKTTDLKNSEVEIDEDNGSVNVTLKTPLEIGTLWKKYSISRTEPAITASYKLKVNGLLASSLRAGIFTFLPSAFDRRSLWIETVNGGFSPEKFYLKGHDLNHHEPVSQSVSATSCLGATEGWVRIGDAEKTIEISTDKSKLFSVPMINFHELEQEDTFFLRLYHTLGEVDDTAWWVWRGYNEAEFTITAKRNKD